MRADLRLGVGVSEGVWLGALRPVDETGVAVIPMRVLRTARVVRLGGVAKGRPRLADFSGTSLSDSSELTDVSVPSEIMLRSLVSEVA
jgi:hypothetical protein